MTDEVVIAGAGVAGSALALALLARGFGVTLRARPARVAQPAVEALPEHAVRLLAELGGAEALARAEPAVVRGFASHWDRARPALLDGWWVHVEREALARQLLAAAVARGARVVTAEGAIGAPPAAAGAFAVDATGRSACWSRPVLRQGRATATLFRGPGAATARPGRIVRLDDGWAYRIDHPALATVGVVGRARPLRHAPLDAAVAAALDIADAADFRACARRPAHAQWAREPIAGARVAVGDAALAYAPLAGQGVRFAVASALAASATLVALRDGGDARAAERYYRDFVRGARDRHCHKLLELADAALPATTEPALADDTPLWFAAAVDETVLQRHGALATGEAVRLRDGGWVRWLGAFDLLTLRDLAQDRVTLAQLCEQLRTAGIAPGQARALVEWCLRKGILARA